MMRCLVGSSTGLFDVALEERAPAKVVGFDEPHHGAIRSPVVFDEHHPGREWVGTTRSGVWWRDGSDAPWRLADTGLVYREVWWLTQHHPSGDLLAGVAPAGLFRLRQGSDRWEEVDALRTVAGREEWSLHLPPHTPRLRSIAVDSGDPDLLVGGIEEGWLVRSTDGGASWTCDRRGLAADVHTVAIVAGSPPTILAATGLGLYRSSDGGGTYERVPGFKPYATHVLGHSHRPKVLFGAGAERLPRWWRRPEGADTAIVRSADGGSTWTTVAGLPPFVGAGPHAAAVHPRAPEVFAVGLSDGTIWLSDDDGRTCRCAATGLPPVTSIAFDPEHL